MAVMSMAGSSAEKGRGLRGLLDLNFGALENDIIPLDEQLMLINYNTI